ncbi:MAG TPA: sulfatase [Phycisphaerae bacterium]|nr:sulfatase [Phycisphaerae bacterium]
MISRRRFLQSLGAGAAALALPRWIPAAAGQIARPNILFLLIDDQRNDTLGCAGHPILKTPTVDRLAAEGVRFTHAFVTTSICAASRASIFTGLYERTHRYTFGTPPIRAEHAAAGYPALLRKAGYRTGFIGKFGVGMAAGTREEMFDYFKPHGRGPYFKKMPDGTTRHETEIAGDRAIEFLGEVPEGTPFCLSVSFNAVHAEDGDKRPGIGHYPWPKAVDGMYEDVTVPPPRLSDPKVFEAHPAFLKKSMNRQRFFWRWDTPEKYQTNIRAYFRMISGVDRVIGRVLAELKRRGLADNTVVIYTGDNGYYMGQRGFAGKWSHYEESLRVPLIVYDPRRPREKRGALVESMALNVDLPATMLDLAGVGVPKHYGGRSLRPLLEGRTPADWRTDFFCEHLMNNAAIPKWEGVRGERYVYARYFEQKPPYEFLHDLKADPDQLENLTADPAAAAVLAKMRTRCDELRDAYGGPYKPHSPGQPKRKKAAKTAAPRT